MTVSELADVEVEVAANVRFSVDVNAAATEVPEGAIKCLYGAQ